MKTLILICLALHFSSSFALNVLLTVNSTQVSTSPAYSGINLGHRSDLSWLSFVKYTGVNSARSFGLNGLGSYSTLQAFATSAGGTWGHDLLNNTVDSLATFNTSVAYLQSVDGRTRGLAANLYPVLWDLLDFNLNTTALLLIS